MVQTMGYTLTADGHAVCHGCGALVHPQYCERHDKFHFDGGVKVDGPGEYLIAPARKVD